MLLPIKPLAAVAARVVAPPAASFLAQKAVVLAGASPATTLSPTAAAAITSIAAPAASALALRGGAGGTAAPAFDLTRARIRLEGLHSYGVVTTLMLNASLRLFSATPKPIKAGERTNNIAKILFTIAIVASVISGLYTTVVFSLLGMYAKTAIGMSKDLQDLEFFQLTQSFRDGAFRTFLLSLISFNSSFILSLFLNYDEKMRWWVAGSAAVLSLCCW